MTDTQRERLVRWQGRLIEQSSYLNNLLLTFGVAIIGYVFSWVGEDIFLSNPEKLNLRIGLAATFISVISGLVGCLSRVFDYRATVYKITAEIRNEYSDIDFSRFLAKSYGVLTWLALYGQILAISIGVIYVSRTLLSYNCSKLF